MRCSTARSTFSSLTLRNCSRRSRSWWASICRGENWLARAGSNRLREKGPNHALRLGKYPCYCHFRLDRRDADSRRRLVLRLQSPRSTPSQDCLGIARGREGQGVFQRVHAEELIIVRRTANIELF